MADIEVFISYSHKDEDIREKLETHLKVMERSGLISTWHDRKIDAGEEWRNAIDKHLDSSQIILLLISADFIASDYCHDIEMLHAMERHEKGEARVIPILLREVDWKGTSLSKLQFLPSNARPIMSKQWASDDAPYYDVYQGLKKVIEKIKSGRIDLGSRLFTATVDQMERGDYITINEAINYSKPGAKILVRRGVYDEDIIIDKPLEIIGDGDQGDVIIRAREGDAILFNAVRGKISNLMLKQYNSNNCALNIINGNLDVEDCDISSDNSSCIAIHSGAYPKIENNKIHGSNQNGILIFDNGQGVIDKNNIYGNDFSGISIEGESNPTIINNSIHDNGNGIYITGNSRGLINNNNIYNNTGLGVRIEAGSKPNIINNEINKNRKSGVYVYESQGLFQNNRIFDNVESGIIIYNSNPTLTKNIIDRNNKNESVSEERQTITESPSEQSKPIEMNLSERQDLIEDGSPGRQLQLIDIPRFKGFQPTDIFSENLLIRGKNFVESVKNFKNSVILGGNDLQIAESPVCEELSNESSSLNITSPEINIYNSGILIHSGNPIVCQNTIKRNNGYGIFILKGEGAIEDNVFLDNEMGPFFAAELSNFKFNRNKENRK